MVAPPDGRRDARDADLDDALVVIVVEILSSVGDRLHLVQHLGKVILDLLVGQREEVTGLRKVTPVEHLGEQLVHRLNEQRQKVKVDKDKGSQLVTTCSIS